ncbi:MAG: hypothetical protein J6K03_05715, partial [Oscillospiraceae bacterium]|nr:hypothetical protein [Oscillospiraceae bacterium]
MAKRFRIQKRLPIEDFMMFLALFFVSSYALLEHVSISIALFSAVKMPLLYGGGVFMIPYVLKILSSLRKKKFFYIFLSLILLFIMLWLSANSNKNTTFGTVAERMTVRLVLYLTELFFLMIWASEKGKGDFVIRFLFGYVFVLVVATDFLLLTKLVVFHNGRFETYLVGNKFTVSYMHMNLLALWFVKNNGRFHFWQKSKVLAILAASVVIIVSIYVDCITGLLGCLALIWLFASINTPFERKIMRLTSPTILTLVLAASVIFPFVAQSIVSIPFIESLLESVLGRSDTLTGRLNIFEVFSLRMGNRWLWGYGYGNGNAISEAIFGYANAQNAILYWVLQAGVLVTGSLILLILLIFRQLS